MELIIKIIEMCANFGAGCASVGACYQPQKPDRLL